MFWKLHVIEISVICFATINSNNDLPFFFLISQDSISSLLAKYMGNGYVDYLQGKWYGQMHCFRENQQFGARVRTQHKSI